MPVLTEPLAELNLLLIALIDVDLIPTAYVHLLERGDVGLSQVLQEGLSLFSCRGCVLYREILKTLTLLDNHARQLKPAITGFLWHSIAPESFQDEFLNVCGLVGELLDRPLIDHVVVPAAINLEASKTRVLRDRICDLVQHLVYRLS